MSTISTVSLIFGAIFFIIFILIGLISQMEREKRAVKVAFFFALSLPVPYIMIAVLPGNLDPIVTYAFLSFTGLIGLIIFFPKRGNLIPGPDLPTVRIDERDTMFARNMLEPGTERYEEYYTAHPHKKKLDDKFRENPGLLNKGSSLYNVFTFSSAQANFETVKCFWSNVDGIPQNTKKECDTDKISEFIKNWAIKLGAYSVGMTELRDYHVYSHLGRQEPYGLEIEKEHRFAIAITVEMDRSMLDYAPHGPAVMESSEQYLKSGTIATQIALFIRQLGYPARAHIDGNYRVVCPLIARDAGLGEIGRMGLLMTPNLGPRVRIAVVTTDLPLNIDQRNYDPTIIDFCQQCNKCADVCPAEAIPYGDRTSIDGIRRWQIDSEACYSFWTHVGTDCARCVSACPYSHPNNFFHNFIRTGIRKFILFRKVARRMDDLFYGRKPPPRIPSGWLDM